MRHGFSTRRFSRSVSHRKSMFVNLAKSLIEHEQIKTTLPKAKDLRPIVEKLITLGKRKDLHAWRQMLSRVGDKKIVQKVFDTLSPRYSLRNGGYLRIMKAGFRRGDNAPLAIIEFIDRTVVEKSVVASDVDSAPLS